MFNKQEKLYKITMILLHKTIKLTTDYHGKGEATGSIPVGSLIKMNELRSRIGYTRGKKLVLY